MEDSFKVRVDRVFGSLEASSSSSSSIKPASSSLCSLWCLTDEEIERNEWIQDKLTDHKDKDEDIHRRKNPKPYSSFLQGLLADSHQAVAEPSTSHPDLESDIEELDDEDDNQKPPLSKPDDHSNEEWNIRSAVGMDCTVDNEEEEDAYDKVALATEEPADRFYMRDVNDYEIEIDSNNELPNSITDVIRDPRANHTAAKLRLKEDDESARKLGLQVSENNIQENVAMDEEAQAQAPGSEIPQNVSSVPDYVLNPSRYTHYTFDSMDDFDEESNKKAYMELFNSLKGWSGMETEDSGAIDSSAPIMFTPRKKSLKKSKLDDGYEEYLQKKVVPISIDSEVCVMEEDEVEMVTSKSSSLQKGGRRYRTKGSGDVE